LHPLLVARPQVLAFDPGVGGRDVRGAGLRFWIDGGNGDRGREFARRQQPARTYPLHHVLDTVDAAGCCHDRRRIGDHRVQALGLLVALALDQHVARAQPNAHVGHAHVAVVGETDEEDHHGQPERDGRAGDHRAAAVADERTPGES